MSKETRTVKLWLMDESPLSRKFHVHPPGSKENKIIHVPRSVTHRVSKDLTSFPSPCVVEIEDWWLEKNEL